MAKLKSIYICQQCEAQQTRWFGKCPQCGEWGTAVETVTAFKSSSRASGINRSGKQVEPVSLASVSRKSTKRISTKISELDRVLGGGLVAGQVVLIAGEPGIGKSTILLQLADKLSSQSGSLLYVSGEESVNQIKLRADRLGVKSKNIKLLEETDVDSIINAMSSFKDRALKGVVIDSIQTMSTSDLSGMAGSVGQVRECAFRLVKFAKSKQIPLFMVGHVTKEGSIAGPSVLMHIVDTVLWFEGDKTLTTRVLRAVKNRFGPTDEVGIFAMEDKGLSPIDAPETLFIETRKGDVSGSAMASILEGTRPMLIEIQSLVVSTKMAYPRRISQGLDAKRYELLLAVLQRRCGLPLYEYDCYSNISGGISVKNDPSVDLAVCLSVASAYFDKQFPRKGVAIGEVGLLGDIREVVAQDKRIKEAKRLGFKNIVSNKEVKYLQQAIKRYLR